jgi:hypothetical protein
MSGDNTIYDDRYMEVLRGPLRVCQGYKPKFGRGQKGGLEVAEFQELYRADEFYAWFGLDSPLVYAAHKAAGGITSLYRQIGIACERLFREILQDHLGLTPVQANWSYEVPGTGKKTRKLSLDGRIELGDVQDSAARDRVKAWMARATERLNVPKKTADNLGGAVFEVRQGYKSKDSKRQNADIGNASNAYANSYLPVVVVMSSQIDGDIRERYTREQWLVLRGILGGSDLDSTYDFTSEVVGYDLAGFFRRNSDTLRRDVESIIQALLT